MGVKLVILGLCLSCCLARTHDLRRRLGGNKAGKRKAGGGGASSIVTKNRQFDTPEDVAARAVSQMDFNESAYGVETAVQPAVRAPSVRNVRPTRTSTVPAPKLKPTATREFTLDGYIKESRGWNKAPGPVVVPEILDLTRGFSCEALYPEETDAIKDLVRKLAESYQSGDLVAQNAAIRFFSGNSKGKIDTLEGSDHYDRLSKLILEDAHRTGDRFFIQHVTALFDGPNAVNALKTRLNA